MSKSNVVTICTLNRKNVRNALKKGVNCNSIIEMITGTLLEFFIGTDKTIDSVIYNYDISKIGMENTYGLREKADIITRHYNGGQYTLIEFNGSRDHIGRTKYIADKNIFYDYMRMQTFSDELDISPVIIYYCNQPDYKSKNLVQYSVEQMNSYPKMFATSIPEDFYERLFVKSYTCSNDELILKGVKVLVNILNKYLFTPTYGKTVDLTNQGYKDLISSVLVTKHPELLVEAKKHITNKRGSLCVKNKALLNIIASSSEFNKNSKITNLHYTKVAAKRKVVK